MRNNMKGICPHCEKETTIESIHREEVFDVRGEPVKVEVHLFKCAECGEEFEDPQASYDPVEEAYRIYRGRKGMVQPEEMRAFRRKYGLTQKELGELLGWGGATLSRYENGALQSEAHDQLLKLVMQPDNLLQLISAKPEVFEAEKRERITGRLQQEKDADCTILNLVEEHTQSRMGVGKNVLRYKGYVAKVEFDEGDEIFHGEVINLRDVITFEGKSVSELKRAMKESIEDYLTFCAERGEEPEKPFSGRFVLRLDPELHEKVTLNAKITNKSLNQWITEILEQAVN